MISEQDKAFLEYIKAHSDIGYGRMMQIISNEWHEQVGEGAFVADTCVAFLRESEKSAFLQILHSEKEQGMDY